MIKHHPDTNTLAEYAAGNLDLAPSIAVAAHLHFCPKCRRQLEQLQTLGGALLNDIEPVEVDENLLGSLLEKLDEQSMPTPTAQTNTKSNLSEFPSVVARLIDDKSKLSWKKLTRSLQIASLTTGQKQYEVSLHKIAAGGKVLEHDHRGMEYTLVLKGSFSDEGGVYQPGDFILKQPGDIHRPYAAANRDCLCLTVVEAPVKFTGWLGKFINPFLKLNPA